MTATARGLAAHFLERFPAPAAVFWDVSRRVGIDDKACLPPPAPRPPDFAFEAVEFAAVDPVLKPIREERLRATLRGRSKLIQLAKREAISSPSRKGWLAHFHGVDQPLQFGRAAACKLNAIFRGSCLA